MSRVAQWLREQLSERGSTRGLAITRLMLAGVLFFRTLQPMYAGEFGDPLARVAAVLLAIAAWFAFVGYRTRVALVIALITYQYLHVYQGMVLGVGNARRGVQLGHALFALAVSPCGRSLSIDRWFEVRRARARGEAPPAEEGPLWSVWILCFAMSAIYFWAAMDKVDANWLRGDRVAVLIMRFLGSSDSYANVPSLMEAAGAVSAISVTALELLLAVGLLIPRFRIYMWIPALILHLSIWGLLGVWPFTITNLAVYPALSSPAWVHRFVSDLVKDDAPAQPSRPPQTSPFVVVARVMASVALIAWCWMGPLRAHVSQGETTPRDTPSSWTWTLHGMRILPACDLQYFEPGPDGTRAGGRVIDRAPLLGSESARTLDHQQRWISRGRLRKQHIEVCRALMKERKVAAVELHAVARCPVSGAWQTVEHGDKNVCRGVRPAPPPKKKKRKKKRKGGGR